MKVVCVYHSIDLDGWMSAAIVKHWWKNQILPASMLLNRSLDFISYNYGDPIPDLSKYDKVIMCDVSFPTDEMNKLISRPDNKNFIWIDHHISMISNSGIWENWAEGLRNINYAACELTWIYFFPSINSKSHDNQPYIPEIIRLLGRYDCCKYKGTDEEQKVLEFQCGARNYITDYESAYRWLIRSLDMHKHYEIPPEEDILKIGKHIYHFITTQDNVL